MFWKNKGVTTTRSTQTSAQRCRRGGISGRSVETRGLPEDGVCPPQAASNCTPLFQEPDHHCWSLGKGRWQCPYLPSDLDAAGPKGGGPVACHVIVSGWLCQGLLQLPGYCGNGTPFAPQFQETLSPLSPERCCGTNSGHWAHLWAGAALHQNGAHTSHRF